MMVPNGRLAFDFSHDYSRVTVFIPSACTSSSLRYFWLAFWLVMRIPFEHTRYGGFPSSFSDQDLLIE